jgi:hypothetical protein
MLIFNGLHFGLNICKTKGKTNSTEIHHCLSLVFRDSAYPLARA